MKAILILFSGDIINEGTLIESLTEVLIEETTSLVDKPQISILSDAEVVKLVISGVAATKKQPEAIFDKDTALLDKYCRELVTVIKSPSTYSSPEAFKRVIVSAVANNHSLVMVPEIMKMICTNRKLSKEIQMVLHAYDLQALPSMLWEIHSVLKIV